MRWRDGEKDGRRERSFGGSSRGIDAIPINVLAFPGERKLPLASEFYLRGK
jgi:hypothetical protein